MVYRGGIMAEEEELAMDIYATFLQRSIWWPNIGRVTRVPMKG